MQKNRENPSEASREKKIRDLAAMDWCHIPYAEIQEYFNGTCLQSIREWRETREYRDAVEELRDTWRDEIAKLPSTADLKKKINHAMTLAVDVLIHTLAGRAATKDKISAARLAAQLDGRFLGADEGPGKLNPQTETLADALLTEIKKSRETIQ